MEMQAGWLEDSAMERKKDTKVPAGSGADGEGTNGKESRRPTKFTLKIPFIFVSVEGRGKMVVRIAGVVVLALLIVMVWVGGSIYYHQEKIKVCEDSYAAGDHESVLAACQELAAAGVAEAGLMIERSEKRAAHRLAMLEQAERESAAREKAERERAMREKAAAASERAARTSPGSEFRDCDQCPEMVVVPAGEFTMGSPLGEERRDDDEGPQHRVAIGEPFAVGKYEVTRGEFARFISATGYSTGGSCRTYEGGSWEERPGRGWRNPGFSQTDRDPVVCVNWQDAQAYVSWLSDKTGKPYRLLSESEWEYAARAGTKTRYHFGSEASQLCRWGNVADQSAKRKYGGWIIANCDDGYVHTAPVGSYKANGFGLHDMHGNVWEWVEDCWNNSYAGAPNDGSAWTSGNCSRRALRGGSWLDAPRFLRSANRIRNDTGNRYNYNGLRIARTL